MNTVLIEAHPLVRTGIAHLLRTLKGVTAVTVVEPDEGMFDAIEANSEAGLLVIGAARLAIPTAPAMYEGSIGPIEPYHYCTPPANLASSNKQPTAGAGDLLGSGDSNQLGSHSTSDNQVLTFFPKASLKAPGAARFHVSVAPTCTDPPAPPTGNKLVGNAYDLSVLGEPGDLPVTFVQPAQVLLRTPPVQYASVQLYYSGAWHATQWGQQGDIANVTVNHSGTLAALDNGSRNAAGKPPDKRAPGIVTVIEVILLAAAIGIVVAAIVVQKRRGGDEAATAAKPAARKRAGRPTRKR